MTKKTTKSSTKTKSKSHKKKPGSKATNPFVPTDEDYKNVLDFAKSGVSKELCRHAVKDGNGKAISLDTFNKYFGDTFEEGVANLLMNCGSKLNKIAQGEKTKPGDAINAINTIYRQKGQFDGKPSLDVTLSGKKDGDAIKTEDVTAAKRTVIGILDRLTNARKSGSSEEVGLDTERQE